MSDAKSKSQRKPTTEVQELEVVKCAARIAVSLAALAGGVVLMVVDSGTFNEWGTGMIGLVVGYWLK